MRVWDALYFTTGEFKPDPQQVGRMESRRVSRQGPGHCARLPYAEELSRRRQDRRNLQRLNLQGWFAPDITNDERTGLGSWSADDIVAYLKTGHNRITAATGPMAEEIEHSTSQMTDERSQGDGDLSEIAARGGTTTRRRSPPSDPLMVAGQAIYRDQCSACHALDGKGVPQSFPVACGTPRACARAIRRRRSASFFAARAASPPQAEPTAPGMPSFAWQLNDEQIAAVVTYIRNSWGTAAAAVTGDDVSKQRSALA